MEDTVFAPVVFSVFFWWKLWLLMVFVTNDFTCAFMNLLLINVLQKNAFKKLLHAKKSRAVIFNNEKIRISKKWENLNFNPITFFSSSLVWRAFPKKIKRKRQHHHLHQQEPHNIGGIRVVFVTFSLRFHHLPFLFVQLYYFMLCYVL